MTDKAYIVANEEQEMTVLVKLEREGMTWSPNEKPTDFVPSECYVGVFPYVIFVKNRLGWNRVSELRNEEIVYDGRKEERMSDKYVVSQEFMNDLKKWKIDYLGNDIVSDIAYVSVADIDNLPSVVGMWWINSDVSAQEDNNRLIAIIRWVNGEDVFEIEKPKKWIVRSIGLTEDDEHYYVSIGKFMGLKRALNTYIISQATRFDTKEEAESWANAHQEVVEVEI